MKNFREALIWSGAVVAIMVVGFLAFRVLLPNGLADLVPETRDTVEPVDPDTQLPMPPALPAESAPAKCVAKDTTADLYQGAVDIGPILGWSFVVDEFENYIGIEIIVTEDQLEAFVDQSQTDPSLIQEDWAGPYVVISRTTSESILDPTAIQLIDEEIGCDTLVPYFISVRNDLFPPTVPPTEDTVLIDA